VSAAADLVLSPDATGVLFLDLPEEQYHADPCPTPSLSNSVAKVLLEHGASVDVQSSEGSTPLQQAAASGHTEMVKLLLDRGADIDARCVDHESTAAQYLVRDAPDVTRLLVARGAWYDIFIAVGLRDMELVDRCLREDPEALDHRTWHGKYRVTHDNQRASDREQIGDHRGDIYRWVFDHHVTALEVASRLGYADIAEQMLARASPTQRLLAACGRGDRAGAMEVAATHPDVVAQLTDEQMSLIAHRAHANDTAAVKLMLDLGFDPLARGVERWEPLRWAVFHGNVAMTEALLRHSPPLNVPDPTYQGTPLGQCLYGALHGWNRDSGDFATTAKLLLNAGEVPDPTDLPTGRDDVDDVLRDALTGSAS